MNYIQKALEELGIANGERFFAKTPMGMHMFRIYEDCGKYIIGNVSAIDSNSEEVIAATYRDALLDILSGSLQIKLIPQFTDDEKAFIRLATGIKWVARDRDGKLFRYDRMPLKSTSSSCWYLLSDGTATRIDDITHFKFASIRWEDTEPTSRAQILGEV